MRQGPKLYAENVRNGQKKISLHFEYLFTIFQNQEISRFIYLLTTITTKATTVSSTTTTTVIPTVTTPTTKMTRATTRSATAITEITTAW